MKVKTQSTSCDYITSGKEYSVDIVDVKREKPRYWITGDNGARLLINIKYCCHIDGGWEIVE